jgi:hypothetical protein
MGQQYGFRASLNLVEILDGNACLENLDVDTRDLALLEGTSAAGVTSSDYQAIIGLTSNLEQQINATSSGVNTIPASFSGKTSRFGDTFSGSVIAQSINNDRPYYDTAYSIYGPSTISYFSPANASGFAAGAQYKLGPVYAATATVSGLNFTGSVIPWNNYFVLYDQCAQFTENSTNVTKKVPLYLAPPSSINSNKVWLDAEYSTFVTNSGNAVEQWVDVLGRGFASQSTTASRPVLTPNLRASKPGVVFDGADDCLSFGDISSSFPSGATVVIAASIGAPVASGDTDYNIFTSLDSVLGRWRETTGSGTLGTFTSALQTGFPATMPSGGTYVFTVTANQASGLQMRTNSVVTATKSNSPTVQVTYSPGSRYTIGAASTSAGAAGGFMTGTIFAVALFDQVLIGKELQSVEKYFSWRFGI